MGKTLNNSPEYQLLLSAYNEMTKAYFQMKKAFGEMKKAYFATDQEREKHFQSAEKYYKLAYVNDVSGLRNKNSYEEVTDKDNYCHIFIDLDNLKWTNDTLGSLVGDELIQIVGTELLKLAGEIPALCFHIHGDEFLVLMKNRKDAKKIADKVQTNLMKTTKQIAGLAQFNGVLITYGIGETYDAADKDCKDQKEQRLRDGKRVRRGEKPINVEMLKKTD
ncbi:diguanylate cyclase [Desulfolutivibrio sulfoxidireducens]|nr:diguanylate cyclase [Desulfolutivibrio sulfoxidireducens]